MPERDLLGAVATYLGSGGLSPVPHIGVAEPIEAADLPAVVLSLEASSRDSVNIGRAVGAIVSAPPALPQSATIALDAPFLAGEPGFSLVSVDRFELVLPHGGLVRADGSPGAITGLDLVVTVGGVARPVVTGPPSALECSCDPVEGTLTFATALPPNGTVVLSYFLGRWEQQLTRLAGTLRVDVVGTPAATVASLSDQVIGLLIAPAARKAIRRLMAIEVTALSSVAADPIDNARRHIAHRRIARFRFAYEHERNQPESSGRVIRSIPIDAALQ